MSDMREVAELAWKRITRRNWQPNTAKLQAAYDLSESQVSYVKKYLHRISEEQGVVWGWHPLSERFILVPHNQRDLAREVLLYGVGHWKEAGNNVGHMFGAAEKQGFITAAWKREMDALRKRFDLAIDRLLTDMGYKV